MIRSHKSANDHCQEEIKPSEASEANSSQAVENKKVKSESLSLPRCRLVLHEICFGIARYFQYTQEEFNLACRYIPRQLGNLKVWIQIWLMSLIIGIVKKYHGKVSSSINGIQLYVHARQVFHSF